MEPLVFDGVGTVHALDINGVLKYIDIKVNSVTAQLQLDWDKVMGGDSGYAFHYTAKDLADKISMEVPRYSPALAELSQGAVNTSGPVTFDEAEEGILDPTNGCTVLAPTKYSGTFTALSDKVYLKGASGVLTPLTRVATVPAATEYAISAAGKVTSASANDGKTIFITYQWGKTSGTETGFGGTRRPKPFQLNHRFELTDDRTNSAVPVQFKIFKCLGGGQLDITQKRKSPTTTTIPLEIMEPDLTLDNPNRYAAVLRFGA
jgi:hypothetical protein